MKFSRVRAALAVVLFISFQLGVAWAKPAQSHEADSAAVKKLFADFNNALNTHNARAVAMLFTSDADYINFRGGITHGRAEIENHVAPLYAGRLKTVHRDVTLKDIHFLSPDTAAVYSDYVTTGLKRPNGTAVPPENGFYDWIVVKQNGRWWIAVWHESNLPAPPRPN